mgnify:CR=1 FL=1
MSSVLKGLNNWRHKVKKWKAEKGNKGIILGTIIRLETGKKSRTNIIFNLKKSSVGTTDINAGFEPGAKNLKYSLIPSLRMSSIGTTDINGAVSQPPKSPFFTIFRYTKMYPQEEIVP